MRVFVGIQLNDEVKLLLANTQHQIKEQAEKGSFTREDNFHLTLRFIGEVDECQLVEIKVALAQVEFEPFMLETAGLGNFKKRSGLIPWVGLKPNEALQTLHRKVNEALAKSGLPEDTLPYTPHLTLGRNVRLESAKWDALVQELPPVSQLVTEIILFQSHLVNDVLTYTPIFGTLLD